MRKDAMRSRSTATLALIPALLLSSMLTALLIGGCPKTSTAPAEKGVEAVTLTESYASPEGPGAPAGPEAGAPESKKAEVQGRLAGDAKQVLARLQALVEAGFLVPNTGAPVAEFLAETDAKDPGFVNSLELGRSVKVKLTKSAALDVSRVLVSYGPDGNPKLVLTIYDASFSYRLSAGTLYKAKSEGRLIWGEKGGVWQVRSGNVKTTHEAQKLEKKEQG